MGAVEFSSRLIGQVLSWPIVVLVLALVFRTPLRELIGRIRSYEGLGQRLTFGEQLADAEEAASEAIGSVTEGSPAPAEAIPLDISGDPAQAIMTAWGELAGSVESLAAGPDGTPSDEPFHSQLAGLLYRRVVNEKYVRAVGELRQLRRRVAHGEHDPTSEEAIAYVRTARELIRAGEVLARLATR